ncbi:MAG: chloride channel protein [bacterium]|nr:MAG: chloride channel protein [bacterium]
MKEDNIREYFTVLIRWIGIAAVAGIPSALVVAAFNSILKYVIARSPALLPRAPYLIPIVGAFLVGILFLRWKPGSGGEGIPSYIIGVNRDWGRFDPVSTVLKFPATIVTLGFHGSGGIVGPLARINAGLSSLLVRWITRPFKSDETGYVRTAAICGVGGAVSAIFHAPLGGGIFAVEILRKDTMRYTDLFPSILSGCAAYLTSFFLLHQSPIFSVETPSLPVPGKLIVWLPLVVIIAGGFGMTFIIIFEKIYRLFREVPGKQPAAAVIGGALICLVWLLNAKWILNTSMPLFAAIGSGDITPLQLSASLESQAPVFFLTVVIVKMLATSFTVSSGLSGGFTGPLIIIGLGSGAFMTSLIGIDPGSPAYFGFLACALAAVLGGSMNIPIAAIIITARIFGTQYIMPAVFGGILSFILFRARTVYEFYSTSSS